MFPRRSKESQVERDIELLVIVGAGASREFGAGQQQLPLMSDLSDAIVEALIMRGSYLEATNLKKGLSGEESNAA